MTYSFFELFHLLESGKPTPPNTHLHDDRDEKEPAFIPSQQKDGERERTANQKKSMRSLDDLVNKVYNTPKPPGTVQMQPQKALPQAPAATASPEAPAKPEAPARSGGADPRAQMPLRSLKSNSRIRDNDLKRTTGNEYKPGIDARNKEKSVARQTDPITDFNDKWNKSKATLHFVSQKLAQLGYQVPPGIFTLSVKPTGRENELVVKPEHAHEALRAARDVFRRERGQNDQTAYHGHFRDALTADREHGQPKTGQQRFTDSLAVKIDGILTKDQKAQEGGVQAQFLGRKMPLAEFIQAMAQRLGRTPQEVAPAVERLLKMAPHLFKGFKSGSIMAIPQGKSNDLEHDKVFSKTDVPRARDTGSGGFDAAPEAPKEAPAEDDEGAFKQMFDRRRSMLDAAIAGKSDKMQAQKAAEQLEKFLMQYQDQPWFEKYANELGGYIDELGKDAAPKKEWSDMDVWGYMDSLVESYTGQY